MLYPTYEHETERVGDLQPCFGQWLWEEEERKPRPAEVRIEAAAEVTDVVRVDDREKLLRLAPQHIWSPQFIHGRYDWEPYKPVFVLLLRAYRLADPTNASCACASTAAAGHGLNWPNLLTTAGAVPAVSEERYARRRELALSLLTGERDD